MLLTSTVYAAELTQPPVDRDLTIQTRQYFKDIADNFNNLEVVTTNPDGSRRGKYGDVLLLYIGGSYYAEFCVSSPSGTVWLGVILSDTP